jgi:hypothetical protein
MNFIIFALSFVAIYVVAVLLFARGMGKVTR